MIGTRRAPRNGRGRRQPQKPQTPPKAELAAAVLAALRACDADLTEKELAARLRADPRAVGAALRLLQAQGQIDSWAPETANGNWLPARARIRLWYSKLFPTASPRQAGTEPNKVEEKDPR